MIWVLILIWCILGATYFAIVYKTWRNIRNIPTTRWAYRSHIVLSDIIRKLLITDFVGFILALIAIILSVLALFLLSVF